MFNSFDHVDGAARVRLRRLFLKKRNVPDVSYVNQSLAVGGHSSIESLHKFRFDAILDLRDEAQDDKNELKKYSISYMRVPTKDREIPTLENIFSAITWLKSKLDEEQKVFIHCNLGRGRAPFIATCFLISNGMEIKDAIKTIKKVRRYTFFNKKQLEMIQRFKIYIDKQVD